MKVRFHGAAGTVTGSMYEIRDVDLGIHGLVDCGSFQGAEGKGTKGWRFEPATLQFVLLTHAHLDHCGRLPALVRDGFRGTIYATIETKALAEASLRSGAHISGSGYTSEDVDTLMTQVEWDTESHAYDKVARRLMFADATAPLYMRMLRSSHLLGAVGFQLSWNTPDRSGAHCAVFYGDSGVEMSGMDTGLLCAYTHASSVPENRVRRLSVVLESTYGARRGEGGSASDRLTQLKRLLDDCVGHGRCLIVPAFSIGRTQDVLFDIARLRQDHPSLAGLRVYGPTEGSLGAQASEIYARYLPEARACRIGPYHRPDVRNVYANRPVWNALGIDITTADGADQAKMFLRRAFGLDSAGDQGSLARPYPKDKHVGEMIQPGTVIVGSSGFGDHGIMGDLLPAALRIPHAMVGLVGYGSPHSMVGRLLTISGLSRDNRLRAGATPFELPDGTTMRWKDVQCDVHALSGYSGHAGIDELKKLAFPHLLPARPGVSVPIADRVFIVHGTDTARRAVRLSLEATKGAEQTEFVQPSLEDGLEYDL